MGTILSYLEEYGDCPLTDMPFNDVDSLVLCQLSYLKFDGIVPDVWSNQPAIALEDIAVHANYEDLFADVRFEEENRTLFENMVLGRRFRQIKLAEYINLVEKEGETQFSAVTVFLGDGNIYIAFRGTDETIVGWKEDFNMAYIHPIPSQAYSVKYLNMVAGKLSNPLIVGGHSKGGNLAMYSAMNCTPSIREQIRKIYSMDGPGFRPEVLVKCNYPQIADKVIKILPRSSLIGMIFEHDILYEVVESTRLGLAQHDPYTWEVEGRHFVKVQDVNELQKFTNGTVNEWILTLNEEQLRTFVDTLYDVISASETDDLIELAADWKKSLNGIVNAAREVDDETRQMIKETLGMLFRIAGFRMKEEVEEFASEFFMNVQRKSMKSEETEGWIRLS